MKLSQTQITPYVNNFLHVEIRDQPFFFNPFEGKPSYHAHPELELVFILEGYGKRIIGNKVADYESGDMVFIGSGVPHVWLSDPVFYQEDSGFRARVAVMYINPRIFETLFDCVKEFDKIKELVHDASKGINIYGDTKNTVAEELISLSSKTGFEKVAGFLHIMHLISISNDKNFIASKDLNSPVGLYSDRLIVVMKYIQENFQNDISLEQVADVACMTKQSFCRFFKSRTKKRFSEYLVELRISNARKLLIELDKPISDIAQLSGYVSISHFCKVFKYHTGQTPYQYKSSINKRAS